MGRGRPPESSCSGFSGCDTEEFLLPWFSTIDLPHKPQRWRTAFKDGVALINNTNNKSPWVSKRNFFDKYIKFVFKEIDYYHRKWSHLYNWLIHTNKWSLVQKEFNAPHHTIFIFLWNSSAQQFSWAWHLLSLPFDPRGAQDAASQTFENMASLFESECVCELVSMLHLRTCHPTLCYWSS